MNKLDKGKLYRYFNGNTSFVAIVGTEGTKWIHYITLGFPIAVHKVKVAEGKYFKDLAYSGDPAARFLELGATMGITKRAEQLLKGK